MHIIIEGHNVFDKQKRNFCHWPHWLTNNYCQQNVWRKETMLRSRQRKSQGHDTEKESRSQQRERVEVTPGRKSQGHAREKESRKSFWGQIRKLILIPAMKETFLEIKKTRFLKSKRERFLESKRETRLILV